MTMISDSILTESLSARDHQLAQIESEQATEILGKIKSLYFALCYTTLNKYIQQQQQKQSACLCCCFV